MELVEALRRASPTRTCASSTPFASRPRTASRRCGSWPTSRDVVVVVGGPDSNNSRKLAELARSLGRPAYLVANVAELRPEWFDGCEVVGLTAGTSTPDPIVQDVRAWLERIAGAGRRGRVTTSRFLRPRRLTSPRPPSSLLWLFCLVRRSVHSVPSRRRFSAVASKSSTASANPSAFFRRVLGRSFLTGRRRPGRRRVA